LGLGIGVWGLGLGVGGWGLGGWGLGVGVWGLGFGVWGLGFGFGVWGLRLGAANVHEIEFNFRAKREHPKMCSGLVPESQGHDLAWTVLYVPYSLDSGRVP